MLSRCLQSFNESLSLVRGHHSRRSCALSLVFEKICTPVPKGRYEDRERIATRIVAGRKVDELSSELNRCSCLITKHCGCHLLGTSKPHQLPCQAILAPEAKCCTRHKEAIQLPMPILSLYLISLVPLSYLSRLRSRHLRLDGRFLLELNNASHDLEAIQILDFFRR